MKARDCAKQSEDTLTVDESEVPEMTAETEMSDMMAETDVPEMTADTKMSDVAVQTNYDDESLLQGSLNSALQQVNLLSETVNRLTPFTEMSVKEKPDVHFIQYITHKWKRGAYTYISVRSLMNSLIRFTTLCCFKDCLQFHITSTTQWKTHIISRVFSYPHQVVTNFLESRFSLSF